MQETAHLVTFIEEIGNAKLHLLCSVLFQISKHKHSITSEFIFKSDLIS